MINIVLFGKPGAGKGTQAEFLKEKYNLTHLSTGDIFRYNIKNDTDLGKLAKTFMDKGDLVPDEVTIQMLQSEVDKNPQSAGFLFDGFPRTLAQAAALDTFLESKKSDLIRNVRDNTEQARQVIQNILNITIEGLIFFSLCSVLIYKSSFSTIIVFILIIIFSLLYAYFSRNLSKKWSLIRQHFESYKIQSLNDSFIGFKEIKIFNKEEWFSQNYNEANINSNLYNFKYGILANIPRIYLELVGALSFFLVIFLNVPDFDRKSIINLIPLLSLYFFAFIRLLPSVNRILTCYESTRFMFPAVKFIYNDLNKNFFIEKVVSNHAFIFKNKIEIKNLSFSFPNDKEIFSNVNLDIKYREKIGIIGDSGIGKTTFVNILTGLIEPSKGLILCNGKNIHKNIRNWQKNIAYIGQKIFLINDTIENNISLGANKNPQHSKRIKESIKFANLNNFINDLPNGVNTIIDDNGSNLSGGQIQRIGIARAIYFNRELIICDEITSSLDFNLEQSIIKSLHELKKTIVIISHKKKNLELCSKIYEKKNKKLILVKTNLI